MHWVARLFVGLLGLAFFTGLLLALGLYTAYAALQWLLTGRQPQVVLIWRQWSALRQGLGPRWSDSARAPSPFGSSPARDNDVVDVPARHVHENQPRLPDDRTA